MSPQMAKLYRKLYFIFYVDKFTGLDQGLIMIIQILTMYSVYCNILQAEIAIIYRKNFDKTDNNVTFNVEY